MLTLRVSSYFTLAYDNCYHSKRETLTHCWVNVNVNINPTVSQRLVLAVIKIQRRPTVLSYPKKHKNICITFIQRRPNVFDVGLTLYKCYTNVFYLLGNLRKAQRPYSYSGVVRGGSMFRMARQAQYISTYVERGGGGGGECVVLVNHEID